MLSQGKAQASLLRSPLSLRPRAYFVVFRVIVYRGLHESASSLPPLFSARLFFSVRGHILLCSVSSFIGDCMNLPLLSLLYSPPPSRPVLRGTPGCPQVLNQGNRARVFAHVLRWCRERGRGEAVIFSFCGSEGQRRPLVIV
jgi:hypothetical protein